MHLVSEHLTDGVLERELLVGEIPATVWTPTDTPAPLILMAHNNGLPRTDPRLVARARCTAARGYAVATIDGSGCGVRPRVAADDEARAEVRRAARAGEPLDEALEALVGPLVERVAPEWRTALDAVLTLPEVAGPVGYSGWAALGVLLAASEPRVAAIGLFAGS